MRWMNSSAEYEEKKEYCLRICGEKADLCRI